MDIRSAVLFACIVSACCGSWRWTTRRVTKKPDNSPLLNGEHVGLFQDAWKTIEQTSNDTYVLMFRSKHYDHENKAKCVFLTANISDSLNKTANYTITYYDTTTNTSNNFTIPVRALNQTDYSLENVIRASFEDDTPSSTPAPPGSSVYIQYNNITCYSQYHPFSDNGKFVFNVRPLLNTYDEMYRDGRNYLFDNFIGAYLDFYVVFSQPKCNVLRVREGCDFWLRKTELPSLLKVAENDDNNEREQRKNYWEEKINKTKTKFQRNPKKCKMYVQRYSIQKAEDVFKNTAFKHLPSDCRFAFLAACGNPAFIIYDPKTCNSSLPANMAES
ncbi:unnamed protein product [Ixodes hexagonus]